MFSRSARKPLKTYSRQRNQSLRDAEPPNKRRRVESSPDSSERRIAVDETDPDRTPLVLESVSSSPRPLSDISSDAAISSDPPVASDAAVSSDQRPRSTPPSSPGSPRSSPPIPQRRPVFSIFKRRSVPDHATEAALGERSHNVQAAPRAPKKKRLVQMQLDLASEITKTCNICGMEYVPSNTEDAALHRKFHAMNVGGVDFTKAFVERLRHSQIWTGRNGSFIAVVGRKDAHAVRNRAYEVLKVVNTELAAVAIPEDELWSQIRTPISSHARSRGSILPSAGSGKREHATGDRFKIYLYIRNQKCIGACLAERIQEAYPVVGQDDAVETSRHGQAVVPDQALMDTTRDLKRADQSNMDTSPRGQGGNTALAPSTRVESPRQQERADDVVPYAECRGSSISVAQVTRPALLGISRIWTSNLHRKQRIASTLLDSARSDFLYGMTIAKSMVAFSQPTESGGQLARKWFMQQDGWLVYTD